MHDRDPELLTTAPVTGRGTRRSAWLAATGVILALVAVVGAGALGRTAQPGPAVPPIPAVLPQTSPDLPSPPEKSSPDPVEGSTGAVVSVPEAGYEVAYEVDATHQPAILDNGTLTVFGFGPRTAWGGYDGTIIVSVGTPARGAALVGTGVPGTVYGATLEDLRVAYLRADPGQAVSRVALEISGQLAIMVRINDGAAGARATVLVVQGGRNFVLTATGFQGLYGDVADNPAQVGLQRFVDGFSFGPSLFVSRELGFQVPMPVEARPLGFTADFPLDQAEGLCVFADGRLQADGGYSHAIGVSVGTRLNPAFARVLPIGNGRPNLTRIWAPSLAKLQAAYQAAVGEIGGSSIISLGGEPAVMIDRPDGLAAAVLAVHRGRAYIISTTGSKVAEAAPGFERFLADFVFLD